MMANQNDHLKLSEDKQVDYTLLEARIAELEKQIEIFRKTLTRAGWLSA